MRSATCSWDELIQCCEDLIALKAEAPTPSRVLIALSQLHQRVEAYLSSKGFSCDLSGQWPSDHPSYQLFCQLSECIESCKDEGAQLNDQISCFLRDILLPQLYEQWEKRLAM